jgi:hypothetical protein
MVRGDRALNKTEKCRICHRNGKVLQPRRIYRKPGIHAQGISDDSREVNVHGIIPARWLTLGMLFLNLAVWLDAAAQLTRG